MSYDRYIKVLAAYTRRVCLAGSMEEAEFFKGGMEKFMERNKHVAERAGEIQQFETWQRGRVRRSASSDKPFITAKDFIFLRELKVGL